MTIRRSVSAGTTPRPTQNGSPLELAKPIACRARRNGNMPPVRAPAQLGSGVTIRQRLAHMPTFSIRRARQVANFRQWRRTNATMAMNKRHLSGAFRRTHSACTTRREMHGNGTKTAGTRAIPVPRPDSRAWMADGRCNQRIVRGGSWISISRYVRSGNRSKINTDRVSIETAFALPLPSALTRDRDSLYQLRAPRCHEIEPHVMGERLQMLGRFK